MRSERITAILFCAFLLCFALLFFLFPQSSFSLSEKRALQTKPSVSVSSVLSGRFGKEVDDWYADQFPFREMFVGLKGAAEILEGKGENNGILLGRAGQLARVRFDMMKEKGIVPDADRLNKEHLRAIAEGVNRAAANARVPTVFLFTGRSIDVAASSFGYPSVDPSALLREMFVADVVSPNISAVLRERYEAGEAVVYRTDHHWTTLGAYYGYCEAMRSFGMEREIIPISAFTPVTVTERFRGTFGAAGGMKWVKPDKIDVWTFPDDGDYTVFADGKPAGGFYTFPPEGDPIGYELFLDGTHDVVTVEKTGEKRPRMVIFKDSFANSLAPFLARHFDLVLLNLSSARKDYTDLTATAEAYNADCVLVVYTVSNLLTSDTAARFR
ncbi:MAG: hypothetical protein J5885_01750 [Clostridia bacterium]|nr:hypothetical protein [Clostridia bacterium]